MADLEELIVVDVSDPVYVEVHEVTVISQGEQGPPGASINVGGTGYIKWTGAAFTAAATVPWTDLSGVPATFTPSAHTHLWTDITGTPTTVAGYGIVDALSIPTGDARYSPLVHTHAWAQITGTPTTLAGYGITDAYTKTQSDANYPLIGGSYANPAWITSLPYSKLTGVPATFAPSAHTHPWTDITSTPTTLAGYGITDAYTKTASDARFAPIAVPWASITGTPTTGTGYGILSIDNIPIGASTASTGRFTTFTATGAGTLPGAGGWTSTGELGIRINGATDRALQLGLPSSVNSTLYGSFSDLTAPSTVTSALYGHQTRLSSAASAFTVGNLVHYAAFSGTAGAGSTVTNVRGFWAFNAIAVGANNYGFYSDINTAANTYQIYMSGTALNYLNGYVGVGTTPSPDVGVFLFNGSAHRSVATSVYGAYVNYTVPATATTAAFSYNSFLTTAASAFTVTEVAHYKATTTTKGAGSTISSVYGFAARNAIAAGTNNYGFYSDIGTATTTYQFYGAGTAPSFMAGPLALFSLGAIGNTIFSAGSSGVQHFSTSTVGVGVYTDYTLPTTMTSHGIGFRTVLRTGASVYTITNVTHFYADSSILGATSVITTVRGFWAVNTIATGATNQGFYSDINTAANTYQLYMNGTAVSFHRTPMNFIVSSTAADIYVRVGAGSTHADTGTSVGSFKTDIIAPSTATTQFIGYDSVIASQAVAFTITSIIHHKASSSSKGAGSTITNVIGFWAANAIAVGTNNYGFYCDINTAATTWAFYAAGTAASFFGGIAQHDKAIIEKEVTVTYSAAMTIDASTGNEQIITATNATAFTINAPTNPVAGQYLEITLRNTSGGALGVATWNAVFKMTAWTSPATGFSRTIIFRYNGTNWVEKGRTAADIPN